MKYEEFTLANKTRCEALEGFNHRISSWSESDWLIAVLGELGELANVVKKLNRVRDGVPGNRETEAQLCAMAVDELADTFVYLDLLSWRLGVDMMEAVSRKFDEVSKRIGYCK